MPPKISVIIPVYNVEALISICLDSLLGQSFKDIEIICVDDCSKDSSLLQLQRYAAEDSRIRVFTQENRGPGGARNRGLDEASGQYILFVDADDYLEPRYCEMCYEAAERHSADIVIVGMKKVYSTYTKDRYKVKREETFDTVQDKIDAVGYESLFYVMNKLIRRESLEQIALRFEEGVYYEDVIFMIRLFHQLGRAVTLPGVNYFYVNHSSGITKGAPTLKKQRDRYVAHKALVEYCEKYNIRLDEKRKSVTVRIWTLLGVTMLKIKERDGRRVWRLLDFIPIYRT
ncbi:MAG: glycosyltransferase family 2 protein [Rikenellaceae bacterium]